MNSGSWPRGPGGTGIQLSSHGVMSSLRLPRERGPSYWSHLAPRAPSIPAAVISPWLSFPSPVLPSQNLAFPQKEEGEKNDQIPGKSDLLFCFLKWHLVSQRLDMFLSCSGKVRGNQSHLRNCVMGPRFLFPNNGVKKNFFNIYVAASGLSCVMWNIL